ncbi:MAG: class I SAM-dependent methyltransferase [Clostridia bacterium]
MEKEIKEFLADIRTLAYENHIPVMRPLTTDLLSQLVSETEIKDALEIGTSIGVSASCLLASSDAFLTTIEIDEDTLDKAKENISKLGYSDRCNFILGDCHEVINMMSGNNKYDFIVLDGPKGHYLELYEMLVPMLKTNGTMLIDDVYYHNLVKNDRLPEKKHRTIVVNLRKLLERAKVDKRVIATSYDIEDGVLVVKKVKEYE